MRLGSRVSFADETGKLYFVVGFHGDCAGQPNPISILTPVGAALIGLAEGQSISYETLDGRVKTLSVLRLLSSS